MKKVMLITVFFTLYAVQSVFGMTVDLWSSFPDIQGQNSLWADAYNPSTNSYRQLADTGAYSFGTPGQGFSVPLLYKDNNSTWIVMHPASNPGQGWTYGTEYAVLAYKATMASFFDLSGEFRAANNSPLINVFVKKNGSVLWNTNLSGNNGSVFNLAGIAMNANDYLYFGVSPAGYDYYDTTLLKGTMNINPIPEPGTFMLLGTGLVGLLGLRRKNG
ncbi:MAG: PEP-CTERM sorting domain-containing protein [bacterium]|nr:PEP-CTERM sorting domain-containing protein [bacterium]